MKQDEDGDWGGSSILVHEWGGGWKLKIHGGW